MYGKYQNSNLVIKNGAFLFLRLLLVLFLGFFTTRLTLQVLGDEKFGIYNIVGGIIAIFAIISMPVRDSLQRFFNVEFTKESIKPSVVFFTSAKIVKWMILIITVLYESIGLFFINYVIKYPAEEQLAVNIIFQISVVSNIYGFAALPYLSLLFAKENMGVPAICEIVGAVLRIVLLYLIPFIPVDILIPYTSIFLLTNWLLYAFYKGYSKRKYLDCFSNEKEIDKDLRKNMLSFSEWSFVEAVAGIALTYVSNIFINIFGGVLYNTAYGISKQLQNAVVSFSSNVMKAADPQITSNTAADNENYRNQLVITTSKISFLGVAYVYVIFHFDGAYLLDLWLDKVPNYALEFCDLAILATIFTSISLPYRTLIMATGKVKGYFISYGIISFVSIIIMYALLCFDFPVISVIYIIAIGGFVTFILTIIYSFKLTSLDIQYVSKHLFCSFIVILITVLVYYASRSIGNSTLMKVLIAIILSFVTLVISSYLLAFNRLEKNKVKQLVKRFKK